ncbi:MULTISPECIES: L-rhamnose mutarotase [Haloarcula]|uniref:L-rhamnose mutarotase n=1 Tax=Haloarcula TaxID=2237 RepID=UPI0023ECCA9E|nr:L-rhamnose mutarotase [Halomicroarcula sp. XH51]
MTERAVYIQRLDPDRRDEYVTAHEDVPEGVTDAMERGGVEAFELYLRDDIAVCILECADVEEYLEAVDGDEAVAEWERHTGQFKREGVDPDADPESGIPFMDRIWRFEPED